MMKATDLFNTALPKALAANAADAKTVNARFQFNIAGAGNWNVDLTQNGPSCKAGIAPADLTVTVDDNNFDKLMQNPQKNALSMILFGHLKIQGDKSLATKLEKVFNYIK